MQTTSRWHLAAAVGCGVGLAAQAAWTHGPAATFLTGQVAPGPAQALWYAGLGAGGAFVVARWNGQAWIPSAAAAPPAREGHAMAFDPAQNRIVLFGGRNLARTAVLADLWEFDGATWQQQAPAGTPPTARFLHAMTWDAGRSRIVMGFGSYNPSVWTSGLGDLWEWDGTAWQLRSTNGPGRIGASLAHDPLRNELVMVGGHALVFQWPVGPVPVAFTETYVLGPTASAWTLRTQTCPTVSAAGFAFDPGRGRLVLAGGSGMGNGQSDPLLSPGSFTTGATSEWNGTTWIAGPQLPSPRSATSLAYDAANNHLVAVGGEYGLDADDATAIGTAGGWTVAGLGAPRALTTIGFDPLRGRLVGVDAILTDSRTWEWNGARWIEVAGTAATPYASYPATAWDPVLQQTLLWRGVAPGASHSNDLFAWNGLVWTQLTPVSRPPARRSTALAADTARNVVVLYGGWVAGPFGGEVTIGDTWEWNGANWSQPALTASPGQRAGARLAFDARRSVMVLHGGTSPVTLLADTWVYDGTQWVQRASTPTAVASPAMAWDEARERIVLNGVGPVQPVTYEFDGATWSSLATASPPVAAGTAHCGGAYDRVAERVVTFANRATWFYETPFKAVATPYGAGCAGRAGVLQLTASSRPWLDATVFGTLAPLATTALPFVVFGFSDTVWNGQPLPLSLAPLGASGCSVFAEPMVVSMLPGGTVSRWFLALPVTTAFAGLSIFAQGGAFDPAANPLGLATSDALALQLGIR